MATGPARFRFSFGFNSGGIVQELRWALRTLRRSPGIAAVAVLSLALGIGANTAIFTLLESTLLRPISVKGLDRLRLLTWREQWGGWVAPNLGYFSYSFGSIYEQRETADGGLMHTDFSPGIYNDFLRRNTVFDSLFTFKELGRVTAVIDGNAEPVNCFAVSGDFYRGMEVSPALGRAIAPENDVLTQDGQVALISYDYWTRKFARSPSVIGKTITLNEVPVTIIGVNPQYFTGIEPGAKFDVWTPLSLSSAVVGRTFLDRAQRQDQAVRSFLDRALRQAVRSFLDEPRAWQIPMMGRLKAGVTEARARSEMEALFQAGVDAEPGPLASLLKDPAKRPRFILSSAARGVDYLTQRYDRLLLALLSLASLVLLMACANVANLLLFKSAVRQREISLRLALGAGRPRVVRQLLTEGLLLAAIAGVAGVILAYCTRNALPSLLATPWKPNPFDAEFDVKALLVSLTLTFVTGVLFSLAPIFRAPIFRSGQVELGEALKDSGGSSASLSKLGIGRVLVAAQIAVSVFLLAGAALCVRTFTNLRGVSPGFRPEGVLMFTLDPPRLRYPAERLVAFTTELQQQIGTLAGVQSVAYSSTPADAVVGPRFFETMGIPILFGRPIDGRDRPDRPLAAVVNRAFMRRYFRHENPIGKSLKGSDGLSYSIVGVCADWHLDHLRTAVSTATYRSFLQAPQGRGPGAAPTPPDVHRAFNAHNAFAVRLPSAPIEFEIRFSGGEANVIQGIRHTVRALDATLAVTDVRTAMQQIENDRSQERLLASLAVVFGFLALILAAIGIYGVMAHAVARRTREIGIRVALGARPGAVAWMVLRDTLTLAAAGIAAGIPALLALSPMLDRLLAPGWENKFVYGVNPRDPAIVVLTALGLVIACIFAAYFPARRAARVDPIRALRHE